MYEILIALMIFIVIFMVVMFFFLILIWKGKSGEERKRIMNVKRTYRNIFSARRRERLDILLITNFTRVIVVKNVLSAGNNVITGVVLDDLNINPRKKGNDPLPEAIRVPFDFWSRIISENANGLCYGTFSRIKKIDKEGNEYHQGMVNVVFSSGDLAEIDTAKELIETLTKKSFDDIQFKYKSVEDAYELAADVAQGMGKNTVETAFQIGRAGFYNKEIPTKFLEGYIREAKDNKTAGEMKEKLEKIIGEFAND